MASSTLTPVERSRLLALCEEVLDLTGDGNATPRPWHVQMDGLTLRTTDTDAPERGPKIATTWSAGVFPVREQVANAFLIEGCCNAAGDLARALRDLLMGEARLLGLIGRVVQEAKHHHAGRGVALDEPGALPSGLRRLLMELEAATTAGEVPSTPQGERATCREPDCILDPDHIEACPCEPVPSQGEVLPCPLSAEERAELEALRRKVEACSLGDRPHSPAVATLRRLMELEARLTTETGDSDRRDGK